MRHDKKHHRVVKIMKRDNSATKRARMLNFLQCHFFGITYSYYIADMFENTLLSLNNFLQTMDGLAYEIIAMQNDCISSPCSFGTKLKLGM